MFPKHESHIENSRFSNLLHTGSGAWPTEQTAQYKQSNNPGQHQNSSDKQQTSVNTNSSYIKIYKI